MVLGLLVLALVGGVLAAPFAVRGGVNLGRTLVERWRRDRPDRELRYDPGTERRAEQRARQLLRSCVNDEEWAMYRDLGFLRVHGRTSARGERGLGRGERGAGRHAVDAYAYLVYAHKPIVAFLPATGQLLSEYCVEFPDIHGDGRTRLPASDDVLAKWMALTSDEQRVIGTANMHLVGRQHDPARLRRDLWRLSEWDRRRGAEEDSLRARG